MEWLTRFFSCPGSKEKNHNSYKFQEKSSIRVIPPSGIVSRIEFSIFLLAKQIVLLLTYVERGGRRGD